ncbi:hypothetical protein AB4Z54_09280 [Streptomyces sp. MCAF7]
MFSLLLAAPAAPAAAPAKAPTPGALDGELLGNLGAGGAALVVTAILVYGMKGGGRGKAR